MIRKRKKPKDYKIRIFTAILFLIIVFLVSIYCKVLWMCQAFHLMQQCEMNLQLIEAIFIQISHLNYFSRRLDMHT